MTDTTARMSLKQLRVRWGSTAPKAGLPPLTVEVLGMGGEMWLKVDDGSKGEDTTYKLEREWTGGA